ncbi:MAG: sigma-70 family RNA polymerase sigma factor [Polyangiaceae bacterium]
MNEPNVERLLREVAPQVLGVLVRRYRDFSTAEDALQEALLAAAQQWPSEGVPTNPRGWLVHVAKRRIVDAQRADLARRRRELLVVMQPEEAQVPPPDAELELEADDTLKLLFVCCHPALTRPSAIALTLRAVGGLTTSEIARAFLVPEATLAQRISRAKQSIRHSQVPFDLPGVRELRERVDAVMHVLYLVFNEGYASGGEQLVRVDLAEEALRLTRQLQSGFPEDPEMMGLLALMLLTHARRRARTTTQGEPIPLDEQDRHLWDRAAIAEGTLLIETAMRRGPVGPYQLQAAIAALHDEARTPEATDWRQIAALYAALHRLTENPMVALNGAVAAAMVHGPAHGLELLDELEQDPRVAGHLRMHVARAHLHERLGQAERALIHYRTAASKTTSSPERDYLLMRAARLQER